MQQTLDSLFLGFQLAVTVFPGVALTFILLAALLWVADRYF